MSGGCKIVEREGMERNKEWSIITETAHSQSNVELFSLTSFRIRARFSLGIHYYESTLSQLMLREEAKALVVYLRSSGEPTETIISRQPSALEED